MRIEIATLATVVGLISAACAADSVPGGKVDTAAPDLDDRVASSTTAAAQPTLIATQEIPSALSGVAQVWGTDFSRATVDLNEIKLGLTALDPRDLIPPIDDPRFAGVGETSWLSDQEPGLSLSVEGDARFYPLAVLTRHEIVNDEISKVPVAVTYCPLCNTAVVFDRRLDGNVLRFGVSGLLRNSDLVMWDDLTESLWQQITGEGIVGEYAGRRLEILPAAIVRWADFSTAYPDGLAMTPDQGFGIPYGANPYAGYTSRTAPYPFFDGDTDERYPALSRVVGITIDGTSKAFPFPELSLVGTVNDVVGTTPVVVFWGAPDTADALDASIIANSDGVGTGVAYSPIVDGRILTFERIDDSSFRDIDTGSTWSVLGKATHGELLGRELEVLPHRNEFWFAWDAFFPHADLWQP